MRNLRLGIGATLFLAFAGAVLPILLAAGLVLHGQARRALDAELARRAEALAATVVAAVPAEIWRAALSLGPGEEDSRTARYLRDRLEAVRESTGVEPIGAWTSDGRLIVEVGLALPIGTPAPRAALLERELAAVAQGKVASTPLFRSERGRWMKIALAPLPATAARRGLLLVGSPSESLGAMAALRGTLLALLAAGAIVVLGIAALLSRALTARIHALAGAAQRVERGDLESAVPVSGADELATLGRGLEAMRLAVRARERELRAMVGSVAHEIRNPLGGLMLYSEMLGRAQGLTPEQAGWADRILQEAQQVERVVAEFLDYARPGNPAPEELDVRLAIAEAAEGAAGSIGWHGTFDAAGEARLRCDPRHMRQILGNVLRNAMQAAGPAGTVRATAGPTPGGVEVRVEDSGPGVAAENRERVFEPFFTTRAEGAGLGLAIVKRLCELNAITITIEASPLGGACVRLRGAGGGKE